MPNWMSNEVIFQNVDTAQQDAILAKCCKADGEIDFNILLPIPIHYWQGDCGEKEERAFPGNWHDWCVANWGTKWNPDERVSITRTHNTMTFEFLTAWSPPMGWLCAVFNTFKVSFIHNYYDAGMMEHIITATWNRSDPECDGSPSWKEETAREETKKRLGWVWEEEKDESEPDTNTA
jgi:hypothetical protein